METKTENKTSPPAEFERLVKRLEAEGFAPDYQKVDRFIIEVLNCKKCAKKLYYKGLSNAVEYVAFGYCICGFIKKFWTEKCVLQRRAGKYAPEKSGEINYVS